MKYLLSVLSLSLLAPAVLGQLPAPVPAVAPVQPMVCLAGLDEKGNVRIRSFYSSPAYPITLKVLVEPEPGKKEERMATMTKRFASEHVLTISPEGIDAYRDGELLDAGKLRQMLAREIAVMMVGQKLPPERLKLLKKGPLVLVCPIPMPPLEGGPPVARPTPVPTRPPDGPEALPPPRP